MTVTQGLGPIVLLAAMLAGLSWLPVRTAETAPPTYCLAGDWPRLSSGITLGQAAGLAMDSAGVVYVFHRADQSVGTPRSIVARARALVERLLMGETPREPIEADTILAIDPESGAVLSSFGAERFVIPHGLTIDAEDNLWVTDIGLHQVFKLSKDGEPLLVLGEPGVSGADRTHFNGPTDVAVASDGGVFVTDGYRNARVVKFSAEGAYLFEWGGPGTGPGQFKVPHGIAIDDRDTLYVADRGNARIQVFAPDGRFLYQISGPEIGRPWAVAVAPDGRLYAVDGGDKDPDAPRSGLLALSRRGDLIARWSGYGYEPGNLVWPHDLAVSGEAEVFVGEVYNANRIQKFTPRCITAAPSG